MEVSFIIIFLKEALYFCKKFLPENGIVAVSSLLHTHLAGRSVKTSLVRKDKVIGHIFDNPKYDFNFQYKVDIMCGSFFYYYPRIPNMEICYSLY